MDLPGRTGSRQSDAPYEAMRRDDTGAALPDYDPYCGPAPQPDALWQAWNLDPWLMPLAAAMLAVCVAMSSVRSRAEVGRLPALAALVVLLVAFVSPLCALATALYSARIAHHLLLVAVAAPLLALALPASRAMLRVPLAVPFLVHTVAMWLWHAPAPYAFALSSDAAYWTMEASLLVSAVWLWQAMLSPATHPGGALAALFGQIVQMGMLGALFTFAGRPLYEAHATSTLPFGLTPLADQQLAGILLWVPAALPYLAAALLIAARLLAPQARRA